MPKLRSRLSSVAPGWLLYVITAGILAVGARVERYETNNGSTLAPDVVGRLVAPPGASNVNATTSIASVINILFIVFVLSESYECKLFNLFGSGTTLANWIGSPPNLRGYSATSRQSFTVTARSLITRDEVLTEMVERVGHESPCVRAIWIDPCLQGWVKIIWSLFKRESSLQDSLVQCELNVAA